MKGADVVMAGIVQYNDWLEEEVGFLPFLEDMFGRLISYVLNWYQPSKQNSVALTCCFFLVRKHGKGGSEGSGGVQEIPDRRAISGF